MTKRIFNALDYVMLYQREGYLHPKSIYQIINIDMGKSEKQYFVYDQKLELGEWCDMLNLIKSKNPKNNPYRV